MEKCVTLTVETDQDGIPLQLSDVDHTRLRCVCRDKNMLHITTPANEVELA